MDSGSRACQHVGVMSRVPPSEPSKPWIQGVVLALGVFGVHAAGACRTIYVGDSGELVAAAATLGIPHPSGYPLYVLLGKAWTEAVPVGSIAFRMSLFSAACAAAACGLLHGLLRRLGASTPAAAFAALLLAFSPSFWSQANVQRVYALNALAVVAVTAAVFEWHRGERDPGRRGGARPIGWLVVAAFLAGLGASNHTFMAVFGAAAGVFALVSEPGLLRRPRHLLACAGAGVAGLLPYAYLPWRSRMEPRLDWGNPETVSSFLDVVVRRDFWHRAWLESPADWLPIAGDYLAGLGAELLWIGAALALVGAVAGWRRGWPVLLPLLAMAGNLVAMGLHGSRSDLFIWHRYYIPSYAMAALLAGLGLEALIRRLGRRWGRRAAAAAFLVPLLLLVVGYPRFDRSRYRLADDFSRTLLDTLPPGAHLAASDDNVLFVLIYLQLVEGVRPDVHLIMQGVGDAELGALRFDPDVDPLYFTHHPNWSLPELEVVPVGLTFRTVRAGRPWPEPVVPKTELDGENDPRVPRDYLTSNLVGHFHYMLGVTWEHRDWPRTAVELREAASAAPENDVLFYNLGLIYRRNGLLRHSLAAFEKAAEINPRHIPSSNPVRPAERVAEARREVARLEELETRLAAGAALDPGLVPGDARYHRRMAALLESAGETLPARGHRLLALEVAAERSPEPDGRFPSTSPTEATRG